MMPRVFMLKPHFDHAREFLPSGFPSRVYLMRALSPPKVALLPILVLTSCSVHHHYPVMPPRAPVSVDEDVSECAPLLPAPEALAETEHGEPRSHPHSHAGEATRGKDEASGEPRVIPHADLAEFENEGAVLVGLATASLGAREFEIWRSSVPPGSTTPVHVHDTEEIFLVLRGQGKLMVGDQVIEFEAPATVIAPAGVPHQLMNTGDIPTDQIVVVGVGSEINTAQGKPMDLPWRK